MIFFKLLLLPSITLIIFYILAAHLELQSDENKDFFPTSLGVPLQPGN